MFLQSLEIRGHKNYLWLYAMELSSAILTLREKQKHDLKASEEYKECQSTLRDTK